MKRKVFIVKGNPSIETSYTISQTIGQPALQKHYNTIKIYNIRHTVTNKSIGESIDIIIDHSGVVLRGRLISVKKGHIELSFQ